MPFVPTRLLLAAPVAVLALSWPAAALGQPSPGAAPRAAAGSSPSPQQTPLVPLPEAEPSDEPAPSEEPTRQPDPTEEAAPTQEASPSPSRRRRRSPSPVPEPVPTRAVVTEAPSPSPVPSPVLSSSGTLSEPLDVGLVDPTPSATAAPASTSATADRPVDPVTRGLQVALGTAALLGLSGATGLYLTREQR